MTREARYEKIVEADEEYLYLSFGSGLFAILMGLIGFYYFSLAYFVSGALFSTSLDCVWRYYQTRKVTWRRVR